jgi:type VI secretion system secreted protein VgrG
VPYPLPAQKTKSTFKSNTSPDGGGSNELRFEDKKGSEEIYLHGQKDQTIKIENDKNQEIGHDETRKVGNNSTVEIKNDETYSVKNNQTVTITNNRSVTIKGDDGLTVTGKISVSSDGGIELTVAGNSIKIEPAGITIKGKTISIEGSVKTEVKGLLTDVSSDGPLVLQGAVVKIN